MTNTASTEGELRQLILNNAANYGSAQVIWAAVDRYAATMAREKLKDVEGWLMSEKARPVGEFQHPTTLQLVSEAIAALASPDGEMKGRSE